MTDEKRIYTIATAHLDTVWNWDFEYVLETCLPKTLDDNFALFEKYPHYRFNFEGAYRYELMEEYYPEKFDSRLLPSTQTSRAFRPKSSPGAVHTAFRLISAFGQAQTESRFLRLLIQSHIAQPSKKSERTTAF